MKGDAFSLISYTFLFIYIFTYGIHLTFVDYISIQIICCILFLISCLLNTRRLFNLKKVIFILFTLILYRIFHGQLWYSETNKIPLLDIRVLTFENSPRGNFVQEWLKKTNLPVAIIDLNNTNPLLNYSQELECTPPCNCNEMKAIKIAYTYRLKLLLLNYNSDSEWLLLLEDDATPFTDFESGLNKLLPTIKDYDYISLDVRTLAGIGWYLSNTMCCTVGVLIRISSMKNMASELKVTSKTNCFVEWDFLLGSMCSKGLINCLAVPLLCENNIKSTISF